jgi:hypothetical protein
MAAGRVATFETRAQEGALLRMRVDEGGSAVCNTRALY